MIDYGVWRTVSARLYAELLSSRAADARRGSHYVRGHYSMDDGRDSLISRMEDIMRGADSKDREVIQRCIDTMRNG